MTEPLPAEGPEREIFLRALRNYSELCEAPDLTAGCPFAVVTPTGRGCLEQCVDLLAQYGAPGPIEDVQIGEFTIRRLGRPRSRRGPAKTSKPFDAREIHLSDAGRRLGERATISLLWELENSLTDPPPADADRCHVRAATIRNCMDELGRRGFDPELLVREGMPSISSSITMSVVMPRLGVCGADSLPTPPPGWEDVILGSVPESAGLDKLLQSALSSERLNEWISSAPLEDIIAWRAPTQSDLVLHSQPREDHSARHRWLVQRFLVTYLDDWETSSLTLEWLYLHGQVAPPCPSREMAARRIEEAELGKVIAHRSVGEAQESRSTIPVERFVRVALQLLREGRREVAANLFEVIVEAEPNNAQALNNFGFCVLPDRPAIALAAFDRASSLGWALAPMILGNKMHALALLGRATSALDLADQLIERFDEIPGMEGWMWEFNSEDPKLVDVTDMRLYALDLAVRIAEDTCDPELARVWEGKRAAVSSRASW